MTFLQNITKNMIISLKFSHNEKNVWIIFTKKDEFLSMTKKDLIENEELDNEKEINEKAEEKAKKKINISKYFEKNMKESFYLDLKNKNDFFSIKEIFNYFYSKDSEKNFKNRLRINLIKNEIKEEKNIYNSLKRKLSGKYHITNILQNLENDKDLDSFFFFFHKLQIEILKNFYPHSYGQKDY